MANDLDLASINFNDDGGGFRVNYIPVNPEDEPEVCTLPTLAPIGEFDLPQNLTTLNQVCRFNFNVPPPNPPVIIPKPVPVVIPCASGLTFNGTGTITGTGGAFAGGSFRIEPDPDVSCTYNLVGDLNVFTPVIACPDGLSISNKEVVIRGTGSAEGYISINLVGGPCGVSLIGTGSIFVPPIPPPRGGGGGGGGGNVSAPCSDCPGDCTSITANIESAYGTLGRDPVLGDVIDMCSFTYTVVGDPNPTTTCPNSIKIVSFVVGSTTWYGQLTRNDCGKFHPFKVWTRNSSGDQFKVYSESHLYLDDSETDLSITGLNSWTSCSGGNDVYLEVTIDSTYTATAAAIQVGAMGDEIVMTGTDPSKTQTTARIRIATILASTGSPLDVGQNVMRNLTMRLTQGIEGYAAARPI